MLPNSESFTVLYRGTFLPIHRFDVNNDLTTEIYVIIFIEGRPI